MKKNMQEVKMKESEETVWSGFAASIPGAGHIRRGIPCQDASKVVLTPRPTAIVCDGRGSAKYSHFGAEKAVEIFAFQTAVMEPFLALALDGEEEKPEQWIKFCRIMYRSLVQAKQSLALQYSATDGKPVPEKEFDFTVAFAIAGKKRIGCFQVGDGAIVLRQNGENMTAFLPEKGEFANQTHFPRPGGEFRDAFQSRLFSTEENSGIAVTSDGPEFLMFQLSDMTPGAIFGNLFDDLRQEKLCRQDLMDYLTRRKWNDDPRGDDDRSIALLVSDNEPEIVPKEQSPEVTEPKQEPAPKDGTPASEERKPEPPEHSFEPKTPEEEHTAEDEPSRQGQNGKGDLSAESEQKCVARPHIAAYIALFAIAWAALGTTCSLTKSHVSNESRQSAPTQAAKAPATHSPASSDSAPAADSVPATVSPPAPALPDTSITPEEHKTAPGTSPVKEEKDIQNGYGDPEMR